MTNFFQYLFTFIQIIFQIVGVIFVFYAIYFYYKSKTGYKLNLKNWFNYTFRKKKMVAQNLEIASTRNKKINEKYFIVKGYKIPAKSFQEAQNLYNDIVNLKVIYTKL